jgi:hypothetical protein
MAEYTIALPVFDFTGMSTTLPPLLGLGRLRPVEK